MILDELIHELEEMRAMYGGSIRVAVWADYGNEGYIIEIGLCKQGDNLPNLENYIYLQSDMVTG